MDKSTLLDDVIRYIYKETDKNENKKIKYTLYINPELKQEFKCFKETCKYLDCLKTSPCKEIVSKILMYSHKLNNFGNPDLAKTEQMNS